MQGFLVHIAVLFQSYFSFNFQSRLHSRFSCRLSELSWILMSSCFISVRCFTLSYDCTKRTINDMTHTGLGLHRGSLFSRERAASRNGSSENAGHEVEGPNCNTRKCKTWWNCRKLLTRWLSLILLILTAFLVRPLQEGHGCITSKMIKYSYWTLNAELQ